MDQVDRAKSLMRQHLQDPVSIQWIADTIGMSPFYLSRLFTNSEGVGPAAFYRRLRLESAASRVADGMPLVDIALDYGFESQQTFTRAFTAVFGMAPGRYRRVNAMEQTNMNTLKVEPRLEPATIVNEPPRRFAGRSVRIDGLNGNKPSSAWAVLDARTSIAGERSGQTYGLCFGEADDGSHTYMAAVLLEDGAEPSGWEVVALPAQGYLKIRQHMPRENFAEHLKAGLERIWTTLLPASGYCATSGADIEIYPDDLVAGQTEGWLTHLVPVQRLA